MLSSFGVTAIFIASACATLHCSGTHLLCDDGKRLIKDTMKLHHRYNFTALIFICPFLSDNCRRKLLSATMATGRDGRKNRDYSFSVLISLSKVCVCSNSARNIPGRATNDKYAKLKQFSVIGVGLIWQKWIKSIRLTVSSRLKSIQGDCLIRTEFFLE